MTDIPTNWVTKVIDNSIERMADRITSDSKSSFKSIKEDFINGVLNDDTFKANRKKTLCAEDFWYILLFMLGFSENEED